jgi:hypothetical protein
MPIRNAPCSLTPGSIGEPRSTRAEGPRHASRTMGRTALLADAARGLRSEQSPEVDSGEACRPAWKSSSSAILTARLCWTAGSGAIGSAAWRTHQRCSSCQEPCWCHPFFILIESLGSRYRVIAPGVPATAVNGRTGRWGHGDPRRRANPERVRCWVVVRRVRRPMLSARPSRAGECARSGPDGRTPFRRFGSTHGPPRAVAGITSPGGALVHMAYLESAARRYRPRPAILDGAAPQYPRTAAVQGAPDCGDGCDRRLQRPLSSDGRPFGQASAGAASERDRAFAGQADEIRAAYPDATIRVLRGSGHGALFTHTVQYVSEIRAFLAAPTRDARRKRGIRRGGSNQLEMDFWSPWFTGHLTYKIEPRADGSVLVSVGNAAATPVPSVAQSDHRPSDGTTPRAAAS